MDPASDTASLFLKMAVSKGMIDDDLAKQVYQEFQSTSKDPSAILLERGILTPHLAENLRKEVQKSLGPKTIGGFRIIEKIGQGGMGVVYKATQISMNRVVALKVLAEGLATNEEFSERFLREAHAAAKVDHPNVVTVHDVGKDGGLLYLAMQFVAGGDADRLAKSQGGRLSPRRAVEIIRDAAKGLAAINRAGLIHRDIKPANIFLTDDGLAKLADLGLSRSDAGEDRMTMTGNILGTPAFMAPEQARGEADLDIRCDIYSLGATLYALLAGQSPFTGNSPLAIAGAVLHLPFPDPATTCPGLEPKLCALIRRCTAKAREERFQTPAELVVALEVILPSLPDMTFMTPVVAPQPDVAAKPAIGPRSAVVPALQVPPAIPAGSPTKTRRSGLLLALVLVSLFGAGLAGWWFGYEAPRRVVAAQQAQAEADRKAAEVVAAAKAAKDEQDRLARVESERKAAAAKAAKDEQDRVERVEAERKAAAAKAAKDEQDRLARVESERKAAELATELAAAKAARDELERQVREATRAKQERDAKVVLDAISALAATASDDQVAQTRRQMESYLAGHAQDPQAAGVSERWRQASGAVDKQRQMDAAARARRIALTAQQDLRQLIAALGDAPSDASLATARAKVDAFLESAPEDLRPAVSTAWEAQQRVIATAKEFGAPVGAWMASKGKDQYGLWADLKVGDVTQRFRWIKPGTFTMGSSQAEKDAALASVPNSKPEWFVTEVMHEVTLTQGYWLADSACTQALWQAITGSNPAKFTDSWQNPVEQVSWDDCQQFLSKLNGRVPGGGFRLPGEAQWEYACRAGTTTAFSFGSTITPEQVNYDGNYPYGGAAKGLYREKTVPVKSLPPNSWGLYEMHGNVWQWCSDWYGDYPAGSVTDPTGPSSGSLRVGRGGSWFNSAGYCRSAFRFRFTPGNRFSRLGFRLAAQATP